jgi:hypothetical protein
VSTVHTPYIHRSLISPGPTTMPSSHRPEAIAPFSCGTLRLGLLLDDLQVIWAKFTSSSLTRMRAWLPAVCARSTWPRGHVVISSRIIRFHCSPMGPSVSLFQARFGHQCIYYECAVLSLGKPFKFSKRPEMRYKLYT